jgi:hypothetical protein
MTRMSILLLAVLLVGGCQPEEPSAMPTCEWIHDYGAAHMQEHPPNHAGPVLHVDTVGVSSDGTRHRIILVQTGPLTVRGDGRCYGGMWVRTSDCVPLVGPSGEALGVEDLRLGMYASLWVSGVEETDPGQAGVYGLRVDSLTTDVFECYR